MKKLTTADRIAAASFIISVCALFLTVYSAWETRSQNRVSVRPRVLLGVEWEEGGKSKIIVTNAGLGPARMISLMVQVDDTPQTSWQGVVSALGIAQPRIEIGWDPVLSPEKSLSILTIAPPESHELVAQWQRVRISWCYCSMYPDECWVSSLSKHGADPDPVSSCPDRDLLDPWQM